MTRKIIVIGTIIIIGLIAGLSLLKSGPGVGTSPKAIVESFFNAVNSGNSTKAEKYLYESTIENALGASSFVFSLLTKEDVLNSLTGVVQKIEIASEDMPDVDYARVKYRLIFKPAVKEKAETQEERNKKFIQDAFFIKDTETKRKMEREHQKDLFLSGFVKEYSEERTAELIKLKKPSEWRITSL